MNPTPIPSSPPSSRGSGSLEIRLVPSPRLLVALASWGVAGGFAIGQCERCSAPGRALLFAACGATLAAALAAALPGMVTAAASGLRSHGPGWQLEVGAAWLDVELQRAVEVLRAGWWLQLRAARGGRRYWIWIDASRTPRRSYRALCRALRQRPRAAVALATGRTGDAFRPRARRRGSRHEPPPSP